MKLAWARRRGAEVTRSTGRKWERHVNSNVGEEKRAEENMVLLKEREQKVKPG